MLIVAERVIKDLEEIVKGREDYIYERAGNSCFYFNDDNTPSCLVGHYLAKLGLDPEVLQGVMNTEEIVSQRIIERLMNAGIEFTPNAIRVLDRAQLHQDCGGTWGSALMEAKRLM